MKYAMLVTCIHLSWKPLYKFIGILLITENDSDNASNTS